MVPEDKEMDHNRETEGSRTLKNCSTMILLAGIGCCILMVHPLQAGYQHFHLNFINLHRTSLEV